MKEKTKLYTLWSNLIKKLSHFAVIRGKHLFYTFGKPHFFSSFSLCRLFLCADVTAAYVLPGTSIVLERRFVCCLACEFVQVSWYSVFYLGMCIFKHVSWFRVGLGALTTRIIMVKVWKYAFLWHVYKQSVLVRICGEEAACSVCYMCIINEQTGIVVSNVWTF